MEAPTTPLELPPRRYRQLRSRPKYRPNRLYSPAPNEAIHIPPTESVISLSILTRIHRTPLVYLASLHVRSPATGLWRAGFHQLGNIFHAPILRRVMEAGNLVTQRRRRPARSIWCQPSGKSGGKSSSHAPAITASALNFLKVSRLGCFTGDIASLRRRELLGPRLSPLEPPKPAKRDRCRILVPVFSLVGISRSDINHQLCKLVGIAGALS